MKGETRGPAKRRMASAAGRKTPSKERNAARSRHAEVLQAAIRVFYRKGYRASTIQDVSDELNFTSAALYYYVESKHELLVNIVMEPNKRLIEMAERLLAMDIPAAERLRRVILEHVTFLLSKREMFGVMNRERVELDSATAKALAEDEERYYRLVRTIIARAADAGEIVVDDLSIATLALIGLVNWTTRWYREDGPRSPEQIAHHFFNIYFLGVAPRMRAGPSPAE